MAKNSRKTNWQNNPQRLDELISEKNTKRNKLNKELNLLREQRAAIRRDTKSLKDEKQAIENTIAEQKPLKESLEEEVSDLTSKKEDLQNANKDLHEENETLSNDSKELDIEIKKKEAYLNELIKKSNLYSKDLAGIGKDSKNKRQIYSIAAAFFLLSSVALVSIWFWIILTWDYSLNVPPRILWNDPFLTFWIMVGTKIATSILVILLAYVFISIGKSFMAENIRATEKMSSIMLIDFLSNKLTDAVQENASPEQLTVITEKQNEIFIEHLPKIISLQESAFEKNVSEKSISQFTKIAKSIKGVLN